MLKKKTKAPLFPSLSLCPLCWAVMWLLYSTSFLDIFYALNVVSLWKAGCTLEDLMGTFTFSRGSNDASTQMFIQPRVFVERDEMRMFSVDDSVAGSKQEADRHLWIFLAFFFLFSLKSNADESPRSYGLLIASMLNTNETCNSVIGYPKKKKSEDGFFFLHAASDQQFCFYWGEKKKW